MSRRVGCLVLLLTCAAALPVNAATIYCTGENGTTLISVDTVTGVATTIGPSGYSATYAAAFTPDGTLWTIVNGSTDGQLATFSLSTGAATPVGTPMGTTDVICLESDIAGNLYAGGFDGSFYAVDKTSGQLTLVGAMGFAGIMDMAFDNAGVLWAVAQIGPNGNDLFVINPATGAGTFVSTLNPVVSAMGLMVDPATNAMYGTDWVVGAYLYDIDPLTGTATPIGSGLGVDAPHGGDIAGQPRSVGIPTLGGVGIVVFIGLLSLAGVIVLRYGLLSVPFSTTSRL